VTTGRSAAGSSVFPRLRDLRREPALEHLDDPLEQWLRWEEQANLVGFRTSTEPVEVEVSALPAERVLLQLAADLPGLLLLRFIRRGRVYFPKHPLNQDASVPFFHAPVAERWKARFTSSRTLAVVPDPGEPAFSVKLPTDHPHPDFVQPEKTHLREEAEDAIRIAALIHRVDAVLGAAPDLRMVKEAITVLVPGTDAGFVVRDLRPLQDGCFYLPALSIPWVGRQIARLHGEGFDHFWGRHYAAPVGRAKALFLARYGLQYETPNPQNILVQLDPALRPTGVMVLRDLGDADSVMREIAEGDNPWGPLGHSLRPETANSFWAFDGAESLSVPAGTLARWYALHDRAYLDALARFFELPRPIACASPGAEAFAALDAFLHSDSGLAHVQRAFERRMA
jgi:hypothetical protein